MPDTLIDIVIHLPDSTDVKLKGRVRRSIKTPVVSIKNGMGIEILENDPRYVNFVKIRFPGCRWKIRTLMALNRIPPFDNVSDEPPPSAPAS